MFKRREAYLDGLAVHTEAIQIHKRKMDETEETLLAQ